MAVGRCRIVDGVEQWMQQSQALPRWRAFLEDLAAIGGHVVSFDHPDEYEVCAPEEMAEVANGLINLWCGPGPCMLSYLAPSTRAAVLAALDDLPNLWVLPELERG